MRNVVFFAMLFGALGACDQTGPNNGNGNDCTGSDCPTDPTKPNEQFAFVDLNIYAGDAAAPCSVFRDGELLGVSGNGPIKIPADEDIVLQVGNGDAWTDETNPRPIHSVDGIDWVYPDLHVNVPEGDTFESEVVLNRYYYGSNARCTLYSSASGNTYEYEYGELGMTNGYTLMLEGIASGIAWMEIHGDMIQFGGEKADVTILEQELGVDTIWFTYERGTSIDEVDCQF